MGRLEPLFLLGSTSVNTGFGFGLIVLLITIEWSPTQFLDIGTLLWLFIAGAAGLFFFGQSLWNMRRYRVSSDKLPMGSLPTISVCIPARNEDHALDDCLSAVLASDYPKLEVLVLDDCSQDKTSTIIRSFAHEGVRFVQGDQPAIGWLGKNQAMHTLAAQASGDYLLFVDVDTHVAPQSISKLVTYALAGKFEMLSVMPQNRLGIASATLFGTLDAFWRIALPITKKHVPVSSKLWLIKADSLKHLGGFASVSRKIVPEESFAHRLFTSHAYKFVVGNKTLGITTAKRWSSQIQTTLRLSYPLLRRQPLATLAACVLLLGLFIGPFALAVAGLLSGSIGIVTWLSAVVSALLLLDYFIVLARTQPTTWLIAGFLWPYVVLQEVFLCAASMVLYEFAEVNWKGRNVCYPVLLPQPVRADEPGAWHR
jgi:chlorobactene glucosyltransferase